MTVKSWEDWKFYNEKGKSFLGAFIVEWSFCNILWIFHKLFFVEFNLKVIYLVFLKLSVFEISSIFNKSLIKIHKIQIYSKLENLFFSLKSFLNLFQKFHHDKLILKSLLRIKNFLEQASAESSWTFWNDFASQNWLWTPKGRFSCFRQMIWFSCCLLRFSYEMMMLKHGWFVNLFRFGIFLRLFQCHIFFTFMFLIFSKRLCSSSISNVSFLTTFATFSPFLRFNYGW